MNADLTVPPSFNAHFRHPFYKYIPCHFARDRMWR